ncbi:MAG TPA: hypothetical protein DEA08_34570, partial [Planctomycetes bacterium]|nr:hypothetical protein [Planctomycetota bacterium]
LGSPGYLAPEQALGSGGIDERTDVYGLGALLFACLTGRPPFEQQGSLLQHLDRVATEAPPAPSRYVGEVPGWLDRVVLRALAKDPQQRYPSVAALRAALAAGPTASPGVGRRAGLGALALACGLAIWLGARGGPREAPALGPGSPVASEDPSQEPAHAALAEAEAALRADRPQAVLAAVHSARALGGELPPSWAELEAVARALRGEEGDRGSAEISRLAADAARLQRTVSEIDRERLPLLSSQEVVKFRAALLTLLETVGRRDLEGLGTRALLRRADRALATYLVFLPSHFTLDGLERFRRAVAGRALGPELQVALAAYQVMRRGVWPVPILKEVPAGLEGSWPALAESLLLLRSLDELGYAELRARADAGTLPVAPDFVRAESGPVARDVFRKVHARLANVERDTFYAFAEAHPTAPLRERYLRWGRVARQRYESCFSFYGSQPDHEGVRFWMEWLLLAGRTEEAARELENLSRDESFEQVLFKAEVHLGLGRHFANEHIRRLREKERGSKDWLLGTSQLAVVQSRMTEGTWRSTLRGAERDAKEAWQLASACLPWRLPAETRRELQGGGLRQRLQAELAQ